MILFQKRVHVRVGKMRKIASRHCKCPIEWMKFGKLRVEVMCCQEMRNYFKVEMKVSLKDEIREFS